MILDRSAKPGWTIRTKQPIPGSVVLTDLDNNGTHEVLVHTYGTGNVHAFSIDGQLLWEAPAKARAGLSYGAVAVGDITGDGAPELVYHQMNTIHILDVDGRPLAGSSHTEPFWSGTPSSDPINLSFRGTGPTLADLDQDGVLDVIVGMRNQGTQRTARVYAFRYSNSTQQLEILPGWPVEMNNFDFVSSASVGEVDLAYAGLEVVVDDQDRVRAWHADGTPLTTGLDGALLPVSITGGSTNAGAGSRSTSQPAIADLDGDGIVEIIVGANVLGLDGLPKPGWEGGHPEAVNALSPAIGDHDGNPANGLEVVVGRYTWHADGSPMAGRPLQGRRPGRRCSKCTRFR